MGHTMKCDKCNRTQRWSSDLIEPSEKKEYMWKVECQYCKHINHFATVTTDNKIETRNNKRLKYMIEHSNKEQEEW